MIEIPAHERDMVRIFAVNGDSSGSGTAQSFLSRLEQSPDAIAEEAVRLAASLGADHIDPTYTETFAVKDVQDMGLSNYIATAMDVPRENLAADRARLDALGGEVLIVLSRALGPGAQTLTPGPELTFIGAYKMADAPLSGPVNPVPVDPTPAAEVPPSPEPNPTSPKQRLKPGLLVLLGVGIAAALLLALTAGRTP